MPSDDHLRIGEAGVQRIDPDPARGTGRARSGFVVAPRGPLRGWETDGMFERFTDRARRVVVLAQEESRLLNHSYIGTEHILLGLVHEEDGVAAQALADSNVSLTSARNAVEGIVGRGDGMPSGHIPFRPRAKKVLEFSLREAM